MSDQQSADVINNTRHETRFTAANNGALVIIAPGANDHLHKSPNIARKISQTGSAGKGEILDRRRSVVMKYSEDGMVQKTSVRSENLVTPGISGPRLNEFQHMQQIGQQLTISTVANTLRTADMVAYSARRLPNGNVRERIIMEAAPGVPLSLLPDTDRRGAYAVLSVAIETARQEGICFRDLSSSNIFANKTEDNRWQFTLSDQD